MKVGYRRRFHPTPLHYDVTRKRADAAAGGPPGVRFCLLPRRQLGSLAGWLANRPLATAGLSSSCAPRALRGPPRRGLAPGPGKTAALTYTTLGSNFRSRTRNAQTYVPRHPPCTKLTLLIFALASACKVPASGPGRRRRLVTARAIGALAG